MATSTIYHFLYYRKKNIWTKEAEKIKKRKHLLKKVVKRLQALNLRPL